jgi:hypothetical protein
MRRLKRFVVAGLMVVALLASVGGAASAAPPPAACHGLHTAHTSMPSQAMAHARVPTMAHAQGTVCEHHP